MNIAILTDFINHDPAYSLCAVVANQVKMLVALGYTPAVLVRQGFSDFGAYPGATIVPLDHGETGSNVVQVGLWAEMEIDALAGQLVDALAGTQVVLTHDLIYQPNLWKAHVAARRVARQRPDLRWLHWVHSSTDLNTAAQTGRFAGELLGPFPNAKLVAFHVEELGRKAALYGCRPDEMVIIPNAIDFTEDYHPLAMRVIEEAGLWDADVIAVYPCRLDRGKQPHIVIELFGALAGHGYRARVVIVDFHSTAGDKAAYRDEMKAMAARLRVPVFFTSDLGGEAAYHVPHKVVMDLLNFGDALIHPSMSEADPLIVPEAAWQRCGLTLNYDLPLFRLYAGAAAFGQFSSAINVTTGMPGSTKTEYSHRPAYLNEVAGAIAGQIEHNPVLKLHAQMRQERSLPAAGRQLWAAIAGPGSRETGNG